MLVVALVFSGKKIHDFIHFNNEWLCMIVLKIKTQNVAVKDVQLRSWGGTQIRRWGADSPPEWIRMDEKQPGSGPPPAPHPEDGRNSCQIWRDYRGSQGARKQNNHMTWEPPPSWGKKKTLEHFDGVRSVETHLNKTATDCYKWFKLYFWLYRYCNLAVILFN